MQKYFAAISLLALTTLMMELVLTRVFDVILNQNMAYMVITCAMFAFGLAGVYTSLRPPNDSRDTGRFISALSFLFAASTLAVLPTMNLLPFDYDEITSRPVLQIASFAGMYLSLALPFFLSGLIFSTLFSIRASKIQSLYCWDLTGAALGCVILVPFLPPFGPGGILFFASALGFFISAIFSDRRLWSAVATLLGIVVLLLPVFHLPQYFDFDEHAAKRGVKDARKAGDVEYSYWDPISKIDVVRQKKRKHIAYDGGSQSSHIYPFDGNLQGLRTNLSNSLHDHFWMPGVLASHYLKRDSNQRVLIIGSAGGQEVKAALMYGAGRVDAVEMVEAVIRVGKTTYAGYNGNILNDHRVDLIRGEGRSFLRASRDRYDIIQIFSNHTSSSIASGTGAMQTTYLQTAEAYQEYFDHLTENGVLHINHHVYPRMITTAALAWKQMGRRSFQKHVAVFEGVGFLDNIPTFLVKMQPWTQAELNEVKQLFSTNFNDNVTYKLVEDPLHPESSFLSEVFYSGLFPAGLDRGMPYRAAPATDNKPYFNFLRKQIGLLTPDPGKFLNASTAGLLNSQMRKFIPMDIVHFFVTGALSLFFTAVFILLPLRFSEAGKSKTPGKMSCMIYFSCLGAGFIIFELVFIQIFMKLIGFPLYTYSTVVFTLLLAAGVGSLCSRALKISLEDRWTWPFTGILLTGTLLLLFHSHIFDIFLASPVSIRILAAACLIFPCGFFLGMPFPLGILAAARMPRGTIAWAWGLNALFTVVGGLLSVIFTILLGFRTTLAFGLSFYLLAYFMFFRVRLAVISEEPAWGKACEVKAASLRTQTPK